MGEKDNGRPRRQRVVIRTEQTAGDREWKRRNRALPLGESERDRWEQQEEENEEG